MNGARNDGLECFAGTSNIALAYKHDLEAIGTNAHELPMALAAMSSSGSDAELKASQYRVLELWQKSYGGALLIMLPDTFGTTQFLEGAPAWVADWTGQRMDSKDPAIAGDEYIAWLTARGKRPAPEAPHRLGRPRRRGHRPPASLLRRSHPLQRWLGHAAHERFPWLPPARRRHA